MLFCVPLLFVLALSASSGSSAAVGTVYTVDTTDGATDNACGNGSDCSFGDAIVAANAHPGKDTIAFNIPGSGSHLIVLPALAAGPFPFVTDAVVIDGETQPGYTNAPLVEIDVGARGDFALLIIGDSSAGTEIRGIAIYGGTSGDDNAIDFDNPGPNVVEHNFIGLDASGTTTKGRGGVAFGRGVVGDGFGSSGNMIADNVIAGTTVAAVFLEEGSDNQVRRNLIGTDPSGTVARSGGLGVGIKLTYGSRNLLKDNIIAAKSEGITVYGPGTVATEDNRIEGNLIGTDITGTVDLGNSTWGIVVQGDATGQLERRARWLRRRSSPRGSRTRSSAPTRVA